jgi:predicted DsbA family dithiol-disulfide isomerase
VAREIAVSFDYRCPFARNAHEAVVTALRDGVDLDVRFLPFSLDQAHVEEGEPPVWDREPSEWGTGVTALLYAIAIRDQFPDSFLDFHLEAFAARHDHGKKLGREEVVREAVAAAGLDVDKVGEEAWSGRPLKTLAAEHSEQVDRFNAFGVPTFIEGDEAVFIRFMERNRVDDLERALELLDWTRFNEFKRTQIPR